MTHDEMWSLPNTHQVLIATHVYLYGFVIFLFSDIIDTGSTKRVFPDLHHGMQMGFRPTIECQSIVLSGNC